MSDRYVVVGQIFIANGTGVITEAGRHVADINLNVTTEGTFTFSMANLTGGVVSSGTATVVGGPVTLTAGPNTITVSGTGTIVLDITIGAGNANYSSVNTYSATSGGACGASVPTASDFVYHDANSFTGAGQVHNVDAVSYCAGMDWTGATNTPALAFSSSLSIYGNVIFIAAMNITGASDIIQASGTNTFTTDSQDITARLVINGGKLTLVDTYLSSGTGDVVLNSGGELDTNGQTVTTRNFTAQSAAAKTLTPGSSTINCAAWNYSGSNLTVTANTATINVSGTGVGAFGSANWNGASFNFNGTAHTLSGNPTGINVLTRNGTATKTDTLTLTSGTTLTCTTFAMVGNSSTNRLLVQSSNLGTAATVTATNWTGSQNVDLMDITATNAVDLSAITGLSGDCGGNTNITFTEAAAQTSGTTDTWSTSGGWTSRVPLPQDDVTCSHSKTVDMPRIGRSITFTGTPTITPADTYNNWFFGSLNLGGRNVNYASYFLYAAGRGTHTITSSGGQATIAINSNGGTYSLVDALDLSLRVLYILRGTFVDSGQPISAARFLSDVTNTRVITKTGTWTLNGSSTLNKWEVNTTNLTFTDTGAIVLTNSTTNAQTFAGGGFTYNNVTVSGAGNYALTITGSNTFNTLDIDISQNYKEIKAPGTTQTVKDLIVGSDCGCGRALCTITGGVWKVTGRPSLNRVLTRNAIISSPGTIDSGNPIDASTRWSQKFVWASG